MTDISNEQPASYPSGVVTSARAASVLPPLMALLYPGAVWCFYNSVSVMRDVEGSDKIIPLLAAVVSLLLTAIPSLTSYLMLLRPLERQDRFAGTRWITYLAFAAPAFFTVERVVVAGFSPTMDDTLFWIPVWAALLIMAGVGRKGSLKPQPAWTRKLQLTHGAVAALILATFLLPHIWNHFLGLLGPQIHIAVMEMLRGFYRAAVVEPVLIALFLFQMVSGARLAAIRQFTQGDRFRTLQVATGVGIMAFLLAHIVVVFGVRLQFGVDTNWTFATGFKIGLLGDLPNARQVPYYWFALVATISHLACGLRVVLLGHGWRTIIVDRVAISIIISGAVLATAILAGMLGIRVG